jgi:hypothetical protein
MEEVTYLYSVNPKKPIKGILENGRPINSSKSLQLTIDQVKKCMECGSVYRWFANEDRLERVTSLNIERLHNDKYYTEEEYASAKFDSVAGNTGTVVDTKTETEPTVEEVAPVVEEVIEEVPVAVEETPVVVAEEDSVNVEETVPTEEPVVEEVKVEEAVTEETVVNEVTADETPVVEEEKVEEVPKAENTNFQTTNYKKKKH